MALTEGERDIIREQEEDARPTGPLCPLCQAELHRSRLVAYAWYCDSAGHLLPFMWFGWEVDEPPIDQALARVLATPARPTDVA